MNDAKTAVILAAGSSRRMGAMTADAPKSLLPYKGRPILERLLDQIARTDIRTIVVVVGYRKQRAIDLVSARPGVIVVENDRYAEDVNIHSMRLALRRVDADGAAVIFEADTIMEDAMVTYVTGTDFEHRSAWFTRGPFTREMHGGIVNSDERGRVIDVRVVPRWEPAYEGYSKMTGVMRVSAAELPLFRSLVEEYADQSIERYFFAPWIDHIARLPSIEGDARHYAFRTFNTPEEYAQVGAIDFDPPPPREAAIELHDVARLRHIEGWSDERVAALSDKIQREAMWTKPLYIEREHGLVLDGQHRLEVARKMGLARVPVQGFRYHDVSVWTLRKEEHVDVATVIRRAAAGDIYPYKTVKHKFPNVIGECRIPLGDLR